MKQTAHSKEIVTDGKTLLKWFLNEQDGKVDTGLMWLSDTGCCEEGNGFSYFIKYGKFLSSSIT
jgi:hypothetical protein